VNCPRRRPSSSPSSWRPYGEAGRQKGRTRGGQRGTTGDNEHTQGGRGRGRRRRKCAWPLLLLFQAKTEKWGQGPVGKEGGRKIKSYTYSTPSLPVSPKTLPQAHCLPSPLQYCILLLFRVTPITQSTPQPGMGLASSPLLPPPPWHPPTTSPHSSLGSGQGHSRRQ